VRRPDGPVSPVSVRVTSVDGRAAGRPAAMRLPGAGVADRGAR